jgi:23S rRNA pseudouridine1911/1915/1917 synthase
MIEPGQSIEIDLPGPTIVEPNADIPLDIIYEDADLLCVDKPAGILAHPTNSDSTNSLVNALMAKYDPQSWDQTERMGIVHRLDKDTSGLILIAKNLPTYKNLQNLFHDRKISKTYTALAYSQPTQDDTEITTNQSRSKHNPTKMKIVGSETGKVSSTHIRRIQSYVIGKESASQLEIKPRTGRMHQIRLHLAHLQMPILGDDKYGSKASKILSMKLGVKRQMLHATRLQFKLSDKTYDITAPLPTDMNRAISSLSRYDKK